MTPRRLWAELRLEMRALQTMREGDGTFRRLFAAGLDRRDLSGFVRLGCPRKHPEAGPLREDQLRSLRERAVASGAAVAGGSVVREWLYLPGPDRDLDLFYPSLEALADAHLAHLRYSNVDVCLYREEPWELFDLEACCCARSASGLSGSPGFHEAMRTGVSQVRLECVVHPRATLQRVAKYGRRYGMRFSAPQLMWMAAVGPVPPGVAEEAMRYAAPDP